MKKLKKLKVNDAVLMTKSEMKATQGGVSAKEYCKTLSDLLGNPDNTWTTGSFGGWWYGWYNNCM